MGRQTSVVTDDWRARWTAPIEEIRVPEKKQIDLKMFLGYSMYALAKFR